MTRTRPLDSWNEHLLFDRYCFPSTVSKDSLLVERYLCTHLGARGRKVELSSREPQ